MQSSHEEVKIIQDLSSNIAFFFTGFHELNRRSSLVKPESQHFDSILLSILHLLWFDHTHHTLLTFLPKLQC